MLVTSSPGLAPLVRAGALEEKQRDVPANCWINRRHADARPILPWQPRTAQVASPDYSVHIDSQGYDGVVSQASVQCHQDWIGQRQSSHNLGNARHPWLIAG